MTENGVNTTVCAIVVTYYPSATLVRNISALRDQACHVIVIDNNTQGVSRRYLEIISQWDRVTVVYNPENLGIAAGLNQGIRLALSFSVAWIATFDQDSLAQPGMLSHMVACAMQIPNADRIAIVCPRYRDEHSQKPLASYSRQLIYDKYVTVFSTMASGNIINRCVFSEIGLFTESLFIDLVDTEFCFRCNQKGFLIIEDQHTWLDHTLGNPRPITLLGKTFLISNHSAVRRYYYYRNLLWLTRHYWKFLCRHPKNAFKIFFWSFLNIIALLIFETDRMKKVQFIIKGIRDGVRGKTGRLS